MKAAVIGITPVGCALSCLLAAYGEDVTLVGPRDKAARIPPGGLAVRQVWDGSVVTARVPVVDRLKFRPDITVFATRTQDTLQAAEAAAPFSRGSVLATIQYGTKIEQIVARVLPRDDIVTCVLTIGANCHAPGDVTLNFKGQMVVGRAYLAGDDKVEAVARLMGRVFTTHVGGKIAHYNCTRLLLNLPYCIPGIIGEKVQKAFSDPAVSEVAVMLLQEGIKVIEQAEVHIENLPDMDEASLRTLLAAPTEEAAMHFGEMVRGLSRVPCEGPVLGSIEHGEPSEIDYQNGEMVKIADTLGYGAPLNRLMVDLVHRVEDGRAFLPKEEFLAEVRRVSASGRARPA